MAKEKRNYLSGREVKAIAKANAKEMKRLEAYKNRKCDETEYLTEMKGEENILEIDNLHSYFFTEQGVVKAVNGVSFDIFVLSTLQLHSHTNNEGPEVERTELESG